MNNLWVRSQDKKKLVKCEGLSLAYRKDKITTDINIEYKEYLETIGTYKSKERALEVLDEMQNKIKEMYILENCKLPKDSCYKKSLAMTDFNIYQMPEN